MIMRLHNNTEDYHFQYTGICKFNAEYKVT